MTLHHHHLLWGNARCFPAALTTKRRNGKGQQALGENATFPFISFPFPNRQIKIGTCSKLCEADNTILIREWRNIQPYEFLKLFPSNMIQSSQNWQSMHLQAPSRRSRHWKYIGFSLSLHQPGVQGHTLVGSLITYGNSKNNWKKHCSSTPFINHMFKTQRNRHQMTIHTPSKVKS